MGDDAAIKEVEELLARANLTKESVHAQAMALHIETIESFDRLIWVAESRRDASLREIDHYRAPFRAEAAPRHRGGERRPRA